MKKMNRSSRNTRETSAATEKEPLPPHERERFAIGRAADGEPDVGCIECDWGELVCHCGSEE